MYTRFAVNMEPFLELKINTDALRFIQELFRLSNAFRQHSPLQIDYIWLRVEGFESQNRKFDQIDPDISELSRVDLDLLTQPDQAKWTLIFNTFQYESRWKAHLWFDLQVIGGSHPLLVRMLSSDADFDPLYIELFERCAALWDAQIVSYGRNRELHMFFERVDVRPYPWLSDLERRYYGKAYDRFAPSVQQTRHERAMRAAEIAEKEADQDEDQVEPATAEAEVPSEANTNGRAPMSPPDTEVSPQLAEPESEHYAGIREAASPDDAPARMYGPTELKVSQLRQLLAEKRQGRHGNKSWTWACEQVDLDLKTAQRHLAAEREEWRAINARRAGRPPAHNEANRSDNEPKEP
jgi:hypothetical protein